MFGSLCNYDKCPNCGKICSSFSYEFTCTGDHGLVVWHKIESIPWKFSCPHCDNMNGKHIRDKIWSCTNCHAVVIEKPSTLRGVK